MKRILALLGAVATTAGLGLFTAPAASAQEPPAFTMSYGTAVPGPNAAAACRASDNVVIVRLEVGGVVVESFPLAEPGQLTTGACVSTVTRQELSTPAYVTNCKALEPLFAAENPSGRAYPYSFYGVPEFTAKNRADCVYFLRGFHTGTLAPGG